LSARIAFFDIETAPSLGYFFDKWKENNIVATECDWYIISFAVKWHGSEKVQTYALPDYPLYKKDKENDRELVEDLHAIFSEADILVAHNGDKFDIRKANTRFLSHGMQPPETYRSVDTLKIARQKFRFDSNRLDDLGQSLGVGRKLPNTGIHLWRMCMQGDPKSWRIMRRYNARDVELLERVYLKLRPWATNHPNLNLYSGRPTKCPTCQSGRVKSKGLSYSRSIVRRRYFCLGCGAQWSGEIVKPETIRLGEMTTRRMEAASETSIRQTNPSPSNRRRAAAPRPGRAAHARTAKNKREKATARTKARA
jgi:hypothetical protein